jgi:alpha-mannosidase
MAPHYQTRFSSEKAAQRISILESLVYRERLPLNSFRYTELSGPLTDLPTAIDFDDSAWKQIFSGDIWGGYEVDFAMRTWLNVPLEWHEKAPFALHLPLGETKDFNHPEALIFLDGLSFASCDRNHQEVPLPKTLADGQAHQLTLAGWCGIFYGNREGKFILRECAMVRIDLPTRELVAWIRNVLEAADQMSETSLEKGALYATLERGFLNLDLREPFGDAFYASVPGALAKLKEDVKKSGAPLNFEIFAAGHAHIDVAWLWTLDQTRRKAERTFHNVLGLMQTHSEFKFSQSQPQLYQFVEESNPELFKKVQMRIAEKRWEPMGGMWVEADCNVSGPESLVRQLLLGRQYYWEKFGKNADSPVLWLPDVFGYAWNLPQLIQEAGIKYFFTVKIGWNQYNRLPFQTFWWQGLDGTRVLTHFSPTPETGITRGGTYNADASGDEVMGTWREYTQKDSKQPGKVLPVLMSFGYGDGGGGPTSEMLESIDIYQDFPGMPKTRYSRVVDFFDRLAEEAKQEPLPVWNGELYLEYHRGTYTTQGRSKRANRKTEFLLHDCEFIQSFATMVTGENYPQRQLTEAWQIVCLNQFHDILPGSSIGEVYAESMRQYAQVKETANSLTRYSAQCIAQKMGTNYLLVNPAPVNHKSPIFLSDSDFNPSMIEHLHLKGIQTQPSDGGWWANIGELPAYSFSNLEDLKSQPVGKNLELLQASVSHLENPFVRVEFNERGDITRLYDKSSQRELLPEGCIANQLQAFEDRPLYWDAWDIDIFYEDKQWVAEPAHSIRVVDNGPLRATVEIQRHILNSLVVQRVSLSHNSPRLDFDTRVDWRERHILLKAAFPLNILNPQATYEIQWGHVQRPTHRNTSWDWARFETCAQKWVDLSEGDFGVSLLNDCKYGHDIHENIMRISLLRSPTSPDPEADQGEHLFTYSLLPHNGPVGMETIREGYLLNDPVSLFAFPELPSLAARHEIFSLIHADQENIVVETIKRAEDGEGWIVRLYEACRRRGKTRLTFAFPIEKAWKTNILEQNQQELACQGQSIELDYHPFQIITLRLVV